MENEEVKTAEIIIPDSLNDIILVSVLEKTRALDHAMKFVPFMKEINELSKAYESMNKENPSAIDVKTARLNRLALVKIRTGSTSQKKTLKEGILTEGKLLDCLDNKIDATADAMEKKYEAIEKHAENLEKERKEKIKSERLEILNKLTDQAALYPLGEMEQASFDDLIKGLELAKEARVQAEKKAEEDKIAKEKEEVEAREKMRIENEKLKAEAEENERLAAIERKKQAEALAKVEAEKKLAEDKAKKEREAAEAKLKKEREENERLAAELKAKEDAEKLAVRLAKEKADKEESERIASEKKAAKAPDKEKLKIFISGFNIPTQPSNLGPDALVAESLIIEKFNAFKKWAESIAENI